MKILHVTPHCGGGVGTVLMGWMDKVIAANDHGHKIASLDYLNNKAIDWADRKGFPLVGNMRTSNFDSVITNSDIVLVHYWDHPMFAELFSRPIPDCRLVFWVHKHYPITEKEVAYPDKCIGTSSIQFLPDWIWSTGNIERFLEIKPKPHKGFNIGYVGTVDYKKLHPSFFDMCLDITARIPGVRFTMVGENHLPPGPWDQMITYVGKVDDVTPYLAEMDIFGYPLRPDHYGTCEQVLGEAMAAGVVPVVWANPAERLIVESYKNGVVAFNKREYIEAIRYLCHNPDERKSGSDMARKRAKELYNIDNMIQQWNDVFESMMKEPKRKRGAL